MTTAVPRRTRGQRWRRNGKRKDTSKVDGVHPKRFSCWLKSPHSTDTAMDVPGTPPLNLRVSHGTDSQLRRTCRTTLVKCNLWAQTTHANKACITVQRGSPCTDVNIYTYRRTLPHTWRPLWRSLFTSLPLSSLLSPLLSSRRLV